MKKVIVIILLLIPVLSLFSQTNQELWIKNSTEMKLTFKDSPFEIRFRPIEQMIMPTKYFGKHSLIRSDLMFGISFWKFKLFSYTKFDEFNGMWTGARLDFNLFFFQKKLLVNLQTRYFFGLNEDSPDHYYLVEFINYEWKDFFNFGILSFATWDMGMALNEGNAFIGPSVLLKFPFNLAIQIAPTKDIFHPELNMLYIKTNYTIKM